jgi:hypothetical protein
MIAARCIEHNQIACWCLSDNIFSNGRSEFRKNLTIRENGLSEIDTISITLDEIKLIPNDMELGSYIRSKFIHNI